MGSSRGEAERAAEPCEDERNGVDSLSNSLRSLATSPEVVDAHRRAPLRQAATAEYLDPTGHVGGVEAHHTACVKC